MEDSRRRGALRMCDYYRRGIFTAEEACKNILFFCVEPSLAPEYMQLLPADLLSAMLALLPRLPATDEQWAAFEGVAQLDGDEYSWAEMISECRAATESARVYLLGSRPSPAGPDFLVQVRADITARLEPYRRAVERAADA